MSTCDSDPACCELAQAYPRMTTKLTKLASLARHAPTYGSRPSKDQRTRARQSKAEQGRARQSKAEQGRAGQSKAEKGRAGQSRA